MSDNSKIIISNSHTNCGICLAPIIQFSAQLRCGHTIHTECLIRLVKNNDYKCIYCRKIYYYNIDNYNNENNSTFYKKDDCINGFFSLCGRYNSSNINDRITEQLFHNQKSISLYDYLLLYTQEELILVNSAKLCNCGKQKYMVDGLDLLPNLETITITESITNTTLNLNKLEKLKQFTAHSTKNIDIFICDKLLYLKFLHCTNNLIKTINNISTNNLKHLNMNDNKITSVVDLVFPKLEYLDLSKNEIEIFENISAPLLSEINLSNNKIKKLNIDLPKLKLVYIGANAISDFSCSSEILYKLIIAKNNIEHLDNINIANLYHLNSSHNPVRSLNINYKNMKHLTISADQIPLLDIDIFNKIYDIDFNNDIYNIYFHKKNLFG